MTTKDEQTIATMFNTIAKQYDFLNTLLSLGQHKHWKKHLVKSIPYKEKGTFLDIATGTGEIIELATHKHPEYSTIIGIDISTEMLRIAKEKVPDTVVLKEMSAMQLELPDNSVDCITISFGIRNMPDIEHVLQECARVLDRNGTLIILEFFNKKTKSKAVDVYTKKILPRIGGLFSSKKAYTYLPGSIESFVTLPQFVDIAKHYFHVQKTTEHALGICSEVVLTPAHKTKI